MHYAAPARSNHVLLHAKHIDRQHQSLRTAVSHVATSTLIVSFRSLEAARNAPARRHHHGSSEIKVTIYKGGWVQPQTPLACNTATNRNKKRLRNNVAIGSVLHWNMNLEVRSISLKQLFTLLSNKVALGRPGAATFCCLAETSQEPSTPWQNQAQKNKLKQRKPQGNKTKTWLIPLLSWGAAAPHPLRALY